jgi:nicotinate-nucleotide adenylyltransferase
MARRPAVRSRGARAPRRVALFGGTFDPPHLAHLVIAEWARDALGLDRVVFMPAGAPPHKRRPDLSPAALRLALTRAAVRGRPGFRVSSLEARRRGPSFTVDTLRALKRRWPRAELYLLIGADSLRELGTWHEPEELLRLATPVVAARPPRGERPARGPRVRSRRKPVLLDNPPLGVSSSLVRARVRAGRSVRFLVPAAVERLIRRHRLYGARRPGGR